MRNGVIPLVAGLVCINEHRLDPLPLRSLESCKEGRSWRLEDRRSARGQGWPVARLLRDLRLVASGLTCRMNRNRRADGCFCDLCC